MNPAKVYYTDLRTRDGDNLPKKLQRLIRAAGIADIDMEKKFVAIKLHFGEPGNLSFLRPNYAKAVADVVKELGGIPFLTDCNTLYVGRRKHALEHLEAAQENGFSPLSTGCQIIIADGLKGTDEVEVPVEGGECVTAAKIGRAVMDADVFISLTHFKARVHRLRLRHQEYRHGVRQPCRQNGAALQRQGFGKPQKVPGLRCLRQELCPGRHLLRGGPQGGDR